MSGLVRMCSLSLSGALIASCTTPDAIVRPDMLSVMPARPVTSGYVAQEVGYLTGDVSSIPYGVNDLGYVVGASLPGATQEPWSFHGFVKAGSQLTMLTNDGYATAIGSGTTIYISGNDHGGFTDRPTRWTFDPQTSALSQEIIDVPGQTVDINDAGLMIGTSNGIATLWPLSGAPETIPPPTGFTRTSGRGVNNAGHASVTFHGATSRGYLRVNGNMIELPPFPGHTLTFSGDVSDPVNGIVYVSGVSAGNVETDYHIARWKVNVETGAVLSVEARREVSEGNGVSSGGALAGQIEGKGNSTGFVWTLTDLLTLKPTKGGSNVEARDMSANGRYVIGSAMYGLSDRGLLWILQ